MSSTVDLQDVDLVTFALPSREEDATSGSRKKGVEMDESLAVVTVTAGNFAGQCHKMAREQRVRELDRVPVSIAVERVKQFVLDNAQLGRVTTRCQLHVGSSNSDSTSWNEYREEVVRALTDLGLQVGFNHTERVGSNMIAELFIMTW